MSIDISPKELSRAVSILARHLNEGGFAFAISGGPDLTNNISAETVSQWLLEIKPTAFAEKTLYGVSMPALILVKDDKSTVYVDIEIFDITLVVQNVPVRIFAASWQLREKIVTAYEQQGSQKMETDLADAEALLDTVDYNALDMSQHRDAVLHMLTQRPRNRELFQVKISCPVVLGDPWTWYQEVYVFVRFEEGIPRYLDEALKRHRFKWGEKKELYYLYSTSNSCFCINENSQLVQWVD
ncbi:hypothetical protein F4782DRAFT_533900 [Xylaria castorea]|nr:hypothetical protein F4782DRAFT_533900 [Xylaria castorea]